MQFGFNRQQMGSWLARLAQSYHPYIVDLEEYDAVILGAGFGAIATLIRLRKLGLKVKVFEKGSDLGGVWHWNCFPGARVDTDSPVYQLFDKELWDGWKFKERYPGRDDLQDYFQHLDRKLDLKRDIQFNTTCTGAEFDEQNDQWIVELDTGLKVRARWFIAAVGVAAKPYTPKYPGIDQFRGVIHHTANWPREGIDLKDKRIAVIGTGASGVQTIQECAQGAKQLTVFQRTPNLALPMNQRVTDAEDVERKKREGYYEATFKLCYNTFGGLAYQFHDKNTFDDTPEERKQLFEDLLIQKGGFNFMAGAYKDLMTDERANREAYNFWRDYVRSRIKDPRKAELLAPTEPPHPFAAKRPSLEQNYYEMCDLPNVDLIDLNSEPIEQFTATGIRTKSGVKEFDVVALATGFDSITGSFGQLDIRGVNGKNVNQHWKAGLKTAIGISLSGFPNMFFLYGPQAPTAFSNGPTCVQLQATWIAHVLSDLIRQDLTRIEAKPEVELEWTALTNKIWHSTLYPKAKSWYQGSNIPGKKEEPLSFVGGLPFYAQALYESLEGGYQGWTIS